MVPLFADAQQLIEPQKEMTATTLTSELEAINAMLDAAGESPVDSLDSSGLADVAAAKSLLSRESRLVQSLGWTFNTEYEYPLTPDVDGLITLPKNTLRVDAQNRFTDVDVVQRGLRLYDRKNHTYAFTNSELKGNITFLLAWDELPQSARHYIMVKAARIYQAESLGSDTQFKFSEKDEAAALIALKGAEEESADHNMLSGSWAVARIIQR